MNDQKAISKLLDTIESLIYTDSVDLSTDELNEFCAVSIYAHKKYGRDIGTARTVIANLDGLDIGTLHFNGLTYEDYQNAYYKTITT